MSAPSVIAANLRRLRQSRVLTQEGLAERAGLSRVGYRKIEGGVSVPRADTLMALASALDVSLGALVQPQPTLQHVRFRSKNLRNRDDVLARVARWLADVQELERLLGESPRPSILEPRFRELSPKDAAAAVRQELQLDEDEIIRDICGLLESRAGVKVYTLDAETDGFFGLSVTEEDGGPAIVVNTSDQITVERWIFTAAHELGHLVLHGDGAYDASKTGEVDKEEQDANCFAGHFLMPDEVFWKEWHAAAGLPFFIQVLKLKRIFRVSYKSVIQRLSERSSDPSKLWARFHIEYKRRHRGKLGQAGEPHPLHQGEFRSSCLEPESHRGREPERLAQSDFSEDRLYGLVRRAVLGEHITLSRAGEILGRPLDDVRELARDWFELAPLERASA